MGFKRNFCCFCCCEKKIKDFVTSSAILFIILAILQILGSIRSLGSKGSDFYTAIGTVILDIVIIFFSIYVAMNLKKKNYGVVRGYGIFMIIVLCIQLILVILTLVLYLLAVGVIGTAVAGGGTQEHEDAAKAIVGFMVIFAAIIYSLIFIMIAWEIHVAVGVYKASVELEKKAEKGSKSSKSSKSSDKAKKEKKDPEEMTQQEYMAQQNGNPQHGYPPQNGYPPYGGYPDQHNNQPDTIQMNDYQKNDQENVNLKNDYMA